MRNSRQSEATTQAYCESTTLPDEAELIRGLRAGRAESFERVVREFGPRVLAIGRRYLGEADAPDGFQETFVAVFQRIDKFEARSSLWFWVRRIAINQCLMRLRQRRRRPEESIEPLLPAYDERGRRVKIVGGTAEGLDEPLEVEELRRLVRQAIERLPDKYRVVILLRDIDGYSTEETAQLLGIKVNAAKVRLHRARQALKSLLEPVLRADGSPDGRGPKARDL